jgi:hypothetical protein
MKKLLNILMILLSSLAFSQFTKHKPPNNDWDIYPETNISYSIGKEDLKEILTLQSLLAEDRVDEMFEMMGKFGYMPIPNNKNVFSKNSINNDITENEIQPFIFIKNLGNNDNFYENYLQVLFSLTIKTSNGIERTLRVNYKQAAQMYNIVYTLFPIGNSYNSLKNTYNESLGLGEGMTMEWVDRYTVKLSSGKEASIYKASNFSKLSPFIKKKEGYQTFVFEGPGKAESTYIYLKKFSNVPEFDKGEYSVPNLTLMSSISDISKTFKPESRKPFNIDFFMSLENFNDRIWLDN